MAAQGGKVARSTAFADGGAGAIDLAELVSAEAERSDADPPKPHFLYDLDEPLLAKLTKVARTVYGADGVSLSAGASKDLERFTAWGYGKLPICVAKTQLSLSDDPSRVGLPVGHTLAVRELRLSAGAGFLVALTGEIVTMPGLPQKPAAWNIALTDSGHIRGLMQNDG